MAKKKTKTLQELADHFRFDVVEPMAKEGKLPYYGELDYASSHVFVSDNVEVDDEYFRWSDFYQSVAYGSNEGIYADIYIRIEDKTHNVLTMKTLGESTEDYVKMSTLAGMVVAALIEHLKKLEREYWNNKKQ